MKPLMQETKRQHCASGREAVNENADRFVEGEKVHEAWLCICIVLLSNTAGVMTGYLQD